jgi:hypothetical protein
MPCYATMRHVAVPMLMLSKAQAPQPFSPFVLRCTSPMGQAATARVFAAHATAQCSTHTRCAACCTLPIARCVAQRTCVCASDANWIVFPPTPAKASMIIRDFAPTRAHRCAMCFAISSGCRARHRPMQSLYDFCRFSDMHRRRCVPAHWCKLLSAAKSSVSRAHVHERLRATVVYCEHSLSDREPAIAVELDAVVKAREQPIPLVPASQYCRPVSHSGPRVSRPLRQSPVCNNALWARHFSTHGSTRRNAAKAHGCGDPGLLYNTALQRMASRLAARA